MGYQVGDPGAFRDPAMVSAGALGADVTLGSGFQRLVAVVARLRRDCPWDAEQTQLTLVKHLVEETAEAVEAIEVGDDTEQREELGDLLIQVCFHAEIAREQGRFNVDDVADAVADKLIGRHPYVFGTEETPSDMMASWEEAKRVEKQRSSCLEGIPDAMNTVARAAKVVTRVRDIHLDVPLPSEQITAVEVGEAMLALVARAQASGIDTDQAMRTAIRDLESRIRAAEAAEGHGDS